MFMLVDPELPARLAEGITKPEAHHLLSTIPFDLAIALRPVMVDPAAMTTYLLTAHLIVFWLSQDSNVTPPVCLAAFTAAGIAGSKPMATGVEAWKIAKGLYVVPLLFAYTPMIGADFDELLRIAVFSLFGIYALNALLQRYSEGPIHWWGYPMLIASAIACFVPLSWLLNIVGAIGVTLVIVVSGRGTSFASPREKSKTPF